jgi:hypothetical protein
MEDIPKQGQAVALDGDISGAFRPVRQEVTFRRNPDAGAAMQYFDLGARRDRKRR